MCRTVPNRKIPSSVIPARSYTFWKPSRSRQSSSPATPQVRWQSIHRLQIDLLIIGVVKRKEIDLPIIGVVKPGAQMAVETTQNKRVGVIATESTIQSGLYQQLITEADPAITVYGKPCPLFVPLVEEGWTKDPITEEVARRYLAEILDKDIDTLIMGCTHYPLLRSLLRKVVGEKVTLVNPAYETSQALRRLLRELDLENPGNDELGRQKYQFFASDGVERFNAFAHSVLPEQISDTKQVQIENY